MVAEKKTILIIDDEAELRDYVRSLLEDEGYQVVTASNGEDGLVQLTKVAPDLIILDLYMNKMGGFEFYKRILQEGSEDVLRAKPLYPILVFTGRTYLKEAFQGLKIEGVVTKPFKNEELLEKVRKILDHPDLSQIS